MELLNKIFKYHIYKLTQDKIDIADALIKLDKEMKCLDTDSISIEMCNHKVLTTIDIKFTEMYDLEGEVGIA